MSSDDQTPISSGLTTFRSPENEYRMEAIPRGSCLIINNEEFKYLRRRKGTEKDRNKFRVIMKSFGFRVKVANNLDSEEMKRRIKEFADSENTKNECDATVIIILSHGQECFICGTGYRKEPEIKDFITYEEIVAFFNNNNCPNLKTKPKMFFFQACLGENISYAVGDGGSEGLDSDETIRFPDTSNVLLAFSTQKGYKSWRDLSAGTYFSQTLIYVLAKKAHELDLLEMLMLVERNMRQTDTLFHDGEKELCLTTYVVLLGWTKKLFFNPTSQEISLVEPQENFQLTLDVYKANYKGLCLIINNMGPINSFHESKLKEGFERLNFLVDVQSDLTTNGMVEVLEKLPKNDKFGAVYDAVIIIILSYGNGECVYGKDYSNCPKGLTYDDIIKYFNNEQCRHLRNKPKLLFFQVCHKKQKFAVGDGPGKFLFKSHSLPKLSETADVLLWFSLYKDCTTENGEHISSVYVSSLHKVLTQLEKNTEIKDIILAVDREFQSVKLKSTEPSTRCTVSLSTSVEFFGWSRDFYLIPYAQDLTGDMIKEGLLLVMGGFVGRRGCSEVEAFISSELRWVKIKNIRDAPSSSVVGVADGHTIFVMEQDNKCFRSFDTLDMEWKKLSDPPVYRYGATASLLENEIYLIGGEHNPGNRCDVYDVKENLWSETTKTNVHRVCHGSATIEGMVFCAGGIEEIRKGVKLDSVESYDPEKREWTFVASMSKPRSHHCIVAFGKRLWTVGGHNGSRYISDLEVYDPSTDEWTPLSPMSTVRYAVSASWFNGLLYAIGGVAGGKSMGTVEAYNPHKNCWTNVPSLSWKKHFHTSVFLKQTSCSQLEGELTFPKISSSSIILSKDLTDDVIKEGVLVAVGGIDSSEVEAYISSEQKWFKIRNIRDAPYDACVAVTDGSKVYVLEIKNKRFRVLDPLEMKWTRLTDPPVYRRVFCPALLRNEIFWMGGDGEDGNQCDVYNIIENSWSKTTKMKVHRVFPCLAALQEKIFSAGGREKNDDGPYLDSVETYDPEKRYWSYVASMSVPRSFHSLVSFGSYLWALGGFNCSGVVKDFEIYDPEKDLWITLKPMLTGRYFLSTTFLNNHLYAVGGTRDGNALITVEKYDPEKNEWTVAPSLNWKKHSHSCFAFQNGVSTFPKTMSHSVMPFKDLTNDLIKEGVLLIMGGICEGRTRSEVEAFISSEQKWFKIRNFRDAPCDDSVAVTDGSTVFVLECRNKRFRSLDPLVMEWKRLSDPPIKRRITSASLLRNEIFWMGGDGEDSNQCDVYNIIEDSWSKTKKMNVHRMFPGSAGLQGKIFCTGGQEGKENGPFLDSVESYDPGTRIWIFVTSMSVPRSHHSLVSFGNYLWALGGVSHSVFVQDLEIYDPEKDWWITLKPMSTGRCLLTANFVGNYLYAVGGYRGEDELNTVEIYDPEKDEWAAAPSLNWKRKLHASTTFQHKGSTFPRMSLHSVKPYKDLTADLLKEGILLVLGGFSEGRFRSEVEAFITSEQKWFKIRNIRDAPNNVTVAVTDGSTIFVWEYTNKRFRLFDPLVMKWKRLSDPPVYRMIISATLITNKIFMMGGDWEDGNKCDIYNITDDSWHKTPEMNVHRCFSSSAALQGKFYCAGGREINDDGPYLDSVEFYDPENRVWSYAASMSVPRNYHSLVSFGSYLWALGGYNLSGNLQDLEFYDLGKDIWIRLKPMPTARYSLSGTFLGNHLYAVGGSCGDGDLTTVERYDPERDDWTALPSLNWKRYWHASLAFQHEVSTFPKMPSHSVIPFKDLTYDMIQEGVLLVMGGHSGSVLRSEMEAFISSEQEWVKIRNITDAPNNEVISVTDGRTIYVMDAANRRFRSLDPFEMKWTRLADPPEYRYGMTACISGNEIYLMGGKSDIGSRCDVYNSAENLWSEIPKMQNQRIFAASATIKGEVFCVGGMEEYDTESTLNSVEFYDPNEERWDFSVSMEEPRYGHSLVAFGGYLWAVGGKKFEGVVTALEIFIPDETVWLTLSHMSTGRSNLSATFFQNRLHVIGGLTDKDETNIVEVYDPEVEEWTIAEPLNWKRQGHAAIVIKI